MFSSGDGGDQTRGTKRQNIQLYSLLEVFFLCLMFMPAILILFSHKQLQKTSKVFVNVFSCRESVDSTSVIKATGINIHRYNF